jgi:hypothetical protein
MEPGKKCLWAVAIDEDFCPNETGYKAGLFGVTQNMAVPIF